MSSPQDEVRGLSRLRLALRFAVLSVAAGIFAMAGSYAAVLYLARGLGADDPPANAHLEPEAPTRMLLRVAGELGELGEAYAFQFPADRPGLSPGAVRWVQREFRPRLESLRQQLYEAPLSELAAARPLQAAADRARTMATHPEDAELRRRALDEIERVDEATWQAVTDTL